MRRPGPALFLALYLVSGLTADAIIVTFGLNGVGSYLLSAAVILAALWYSRNVQRATVLLFHIFIYPALATLMLPPFHIAALYAIAIPVTLGVSEAIYRIVQDHAASLERERVAQARLQHIVANSPMATYTLEIRPGQSPAIRCTFSTASLERLLGLSAEAIIEDHEGWLARVHPEDRERIRATHLGVRPPVIEFRFTRPDGAEIWLEDTAQLITHGSDGPVEIIAQVQDITDRKRAQAQIEESQRFTAQLAAAIPSQVMVVDLETNSVVYTNRTSAHPTAAGFSHPFVPCERFRRDLHPDDQTTYTAALEAIDTLADDQTLKTRLRLNKHGSDWREIEFHYRVFKRDRHGRPTQILTVWDDVTESGRAARDLAENQRLLGRIAEALPSTVFILDPQADLGRGVFNYVNRYLLDTLGYTDASMEQRQSLAFTLHLMHPDDMVRSQALLSQTNAFQSESWLNLEYRLKAADGTWHWIQARLTVFETDTSGRPTQVLGVADDVTAIRQAQTDLANSQRLLQRVAEAIPDTLYVLDIRDTGHETGVIFGNRSLPGQLGYSSLETNGIRWDQFLRDCLHPDDLPRFKAVRQAWLSLPDGALLETEFRLKNAAGEWRWMQGRHLAFERDDTGALTQIIGVLQDITEHKQLQTEIRSERDFAQLVLNTVGQGLTVISPDGLCEYLNPAGAQILGMEAADVVGTPLDRVMSNDAQREALQASLADLAHSPETVRVDVQFDRPDGRKLDLLTAVSPRIKDGAFIGTVVAFTDVSERRAMERDLAQALVRAQELTRDAQTATRAKSDFLANMSHEIRTPMNAIIGMAEMLQSAALPEDQRGAVQIMMDSGQALLDIINDILDFSKIEAGRVDLDPHDFNLTSLVESAADLLALRARAKGLRITTYVDPTIPRVLRGDSGRLRQVLLNLLSNAVKFTSQGRIAVRADLEQGGGESTRVCLSVQDTGIGIAPEAQPRLFQPFEQAEHSTTRRYGGTGLGLAIVKRLVELMGGDVQLTSLPGAGTTIRLYVPFAATEQPVEDQPRLRGRALVVDPDPISCAILQGYVAASGLTCDVVGSPADVFARLSQDQGYDVLVVGVWADQHETQHVVDRLSQDPRFGRLPRVIVTDTADSAKPDLVSRPIKRSRLVESLELALRPVPRPIETPHEPIVFVPAVAPADRPCVLLAEDNPVNQTVARLQLEKLGYEVDVAHDGVAAVAAYCAAPSRYSLVLMDCQMPQMDGFEATHAIRAWEAAEIGRAHIHIIAMTANAMAGDREECLAAGMDDYLSKPVSRQALQTVLMRAQPV